MGRLGGSGRKLGRKSHYTVFGWGEREGRERGDSGDVYVSVCSSDVVVMYLGFYPCYFSAPTGLVYELYDE